MEDRQEKNEGLQLQTDTPKIDTVSNAIEIENVNASWDIDEGKTLDNISIAVKPGHLCAIIGPVGAGKVYIYRIYRWYGIRIIENELRK